MRAQRLLSVNDFVTSGIEWKTAALKLLIESILKQAGLK